jgi:hypothetical protein
VRNLRDHAIVVTLVSLLIPAVAGASVSLAFVDQDGTTNGSVNVAAGGSFNVRLNLVTTSSTTDDHTGLDYYLTLLEGSSGSGLFSIQDRNIGASPYSDVIFDDTVVEALPSALLNLRNDDDLGAAVASSTPAENSATYNAGTFLVAIFTIKVDPAAPSGTYSLQTTSDPGTGWSGRHDVVNDPYPDNEFAQHANYSIVVIPEPTGLAAFGALCLILVRRRNRA